MASILFEWLTLLTLSLALLIGGSAGWAGDRLLALPALLLGAVALARVLMDPDVSPGRWRAFWLLPALLLALPLLQLIPLPFALWSRLPGRESIATALQSAGVAPAWHALSVAPFLTERAFESLLIPAGMFMAAVVLGGEQRRRLVALTLAIAALNVLLGLSQLLEGPTSSLYFYAVSSRDSASGFFSNRNHLASLLASSVPIAVGMLMDRLRHPHRAERDLRVWLLSALIVLLAVGATATRARVAYLMLALSVIAGVVVGWRGRREQGRFGSKGWVGLLALLVVVLVVQFTLRAVLLRLQMQTESTEGSRATLALQTLQLAAPARGTGFGIGSFPLVYNQLGDGVANTRFYINHAHNDYLELWLEGGAAALLLALAALAALARQLGRMLRAGLVESDGRGTRRPRRGFELGAGFALALLALHSAIDYPLRTTALQVYAALLCAVLVGSVRPGKPVFR